MKKTKYKQTEVGMIPEDWDVRKIGDFVDIKHGYAFKGEFFTDIPNDNVVLTPGNFRIGGGFKPEKFKYTTEQYPDEYVLNEGDVLVAMTDLSKEGDTLGFAAKIPPHNLLKFLHNQRLGLLKFKSKVSKEFIYWVLRNKKYNLFVVGSATGSTVKHTSPDRIKQYPLGIPPSCSEQENIANILSSLDSKIELLQEQNKTLEAIGQAIFKHWFIDFEFPDKNGKPYKSSGGKMVESEMGMIPEGWRISSIGEEVVVKGGSTPSTDKDEYWNGNIYWCTPKDLSRLKSPVLLYTEKKISKLGLDTISSGLLPKGTLLLSSRAPIGYVAVSQIDVAINQGFVALLCERSVSNRFMMYWIKANLDVIKSMANGSTFQEVNKSSFRTIPITVPDNATLRGFDAIVANLFNGIVNNEAESESLSQLLDSLLPKLMSGRIRVPVEAE